jgi:expansin (peptidoglycan-binding protein)
MRVVGILLLLSACGGLGGRRDGGEASFDGDLDADVGVALEGGVPRPDGCVVSCNAVTPSYPSVHANGGEGNITMYATGPSAGGACNYGVTSVLHYAAVNVNVAPGDGQGQWQGGRICGQCVAVTASTSQGPRTVIVRIMDKCPDGDCGIDLGGSAPAAIMLDGFGRYDGSWRFVSCTGHPEVSDGSPSLFVSDGSNAWWSRVQVRNPPSAVASIAWQGPAGSAPGMFPYATDPEDTFEVPMEVLQSSATSIAVTVLYTDGTSATVQLGPGQLAAANTAYPLN